MNTMVSCIKQQLMLYGKLLGHPVCDPHAAAPARPLRKKLQMLYCLHDIPSASLLVSAGNMKGFVSADGHSGNAHLLSCLRSSMLQQLREPPFRKKLQMLYCLYDIPSASALLMKYH
ncbi:hypothetical protein G9A89_023129 [Geosiphon pyriformis]|nr:hypothetical protein G9A89_023129 [Geosiphon pyriformis]